MTTPSNNSSKFFEGAQDVDASYSTMNVAGGNLSITNHNNFSPHREPGTGLRNLYKFISNAGALGALYNSGARFPPPKCHPGTREKILKSFSDWIGADTTKTSLFIPNPTSSLDHTEFSPIQWLYGPAGAGKSAIAQTLCDRFREHLIGSFFFSRSSPTRNNPKFLFLTIAYCVATLSNDEDLRTAIDHAVCENPAILYASIDVHFRDLVVEPLRSLPLWKWCYLPKLIIIDGLDECIGSESQRTIMKTIRDGLVGPVSAGLRYSIPLRFVIASRPELAIRGLFDQPEFYSLSNRIKLGDGFETSKDIAVYLSDELSQIASRYSIEMPWPKHGIAEVLAQRASGQFIYATTVLKYVGDEGGSPPRRLDIILQSPLTDGEAFTDLDMLYRQILISNPQKKLSLVLHTLAFMLMTSKFSKVVMLEQLFELPEDSVSIVLRGLHSVANISRESNSVIIYHKSFVDFLRDHRRSKDYYINRDSYVDETLCRFDGLGDKLQSCEPGNISEMDILQSQFELLGELSDIERAIGFFQKAAELTPEGHAHKPRKLYNLGNAFRSRFSHLGLLNDIEKAIGILQKAVDLTPDGHADKPAMLTNLGGAFQSRFSHLGELNDIEKAIGVKQKAVDLTPDGHADKPGRLKNLGAAFQSRFSHLGELNDIEKAIGVLQKAVDLTPDGHADKPGWLSNLGNAFHLLFTQSQNFCNLSQACSAYQNASLQPSGPPSVKIRAAMLWARYSSSADLALSAYTRFLELIPQVVWLGQTIHQCYKDLPLISSTINAATATAISVNDLHKAIEWLEEGRSIIWGQVLQLQSPIDHLYDHLPHLADDLKRISRILENSGTSRGDGMHNNTAESNMSMEQEAQQHREMARKYEHLIQQIRSHEGFGNFFKPKTFSELVPAAINGPIIILNSHIPQSDALILCSSGNIIHVPLPVFSSNKAKQFQSRLAASLDVRKIYQNLFESAEVVDSLQSILADLWSFVIQPILPELEGLLWEITHDDLPHITWCATGALAFLPLHAAGIYGTGDVSKNINVSDFAVSSYTTTLTAMLGNHSRTKQAGKESSRILIISQPATPGHQLLPGTKEEAIVVQKHTSPEHTLHLSHTEATVAEVVQAMSKYNIVHLACHGIQDPNPLDSAFALYDGKLTLKTLMGLSLDNAELAFLSACQTATGDKNLPEEAVHLAAGMLAVGYPSVIATMWSIGDREVPMVADKVYQSLFGRGPEDQGKKLAPAYALHKAIKHLQAEVGEMNFVKWVPFVHFGV